MEKNGLGARNPSVRLVRHKSELCGNKRPKSEVICAGVGIIVTALDKCIIMVVPTGKRLRTLAICRLEISLTKLPLVYY